MFMTSRIDRISTARAGVMVSVGMSDQEMTSYIKETFCVDSTYEAKQLFDAAELPPSWQSVWRGINSPGWEQGAVGSPCRGITMPWDHLLSVNGHGPKQSSARIQRCSCAV